MDKNFLRRHCFRHMLQLVIHSVFGLALFVPCIAHSASSNAAQQPASHFYRLPNLLQPQLSPSGKYLSARIAVDNQLGLLISDLDGAEDPILLGGGRQKGKGRRACMCVLIYIYIYMYIVMLYDLLYYI